MFIWRIVGRVEWVGIGGGGACGFFGGGGVDIILTHS